VALPRRPRLRLRRRRRHARKVVRSRPRIGRASLARTRAGRAERLAELALAVPGWLGVVGKRKRGRQAGGPQPFRWAGRAAQAGALREESGGPGAHMGRGAATRGKEGNKTRKSSPLPRAPSPAGQNENTDQSGHATEYRAFLTAAAGKQSAAQLHRWARRQLSSAKISHDPKKFQ
jgi:hypothetical protein